MIRSSRGRPSAKRISKVSSNATKYPHKPSSLQTVKSGHMSSTLSSRSHSSVHHHTSVISPRRLESARVFRPNRGQHVLSKRSFISTASCHPANYDPDCPPHPSEFAPSVSNVLYDSLDRKNSTQEQEIKTSPKPAPIATNTTDTPLHSAYQSPFPSTDRLYDKKVRSVLLVKKWKSKAATHHSNEIAAYLRDKNVQVFVEPSCVNDFDHPYPSVFDILHQSDAAFPHHISSCFPVLDGSPLTSTSTLVSQVQSLPPDTQKDYMKNLSSNEFWKDFYRDNKNMSLLSQLDPRECIAFVRKFNKWQEFIDVIIAVGGDGTLLHVSTLFSHQVPPVLGFSCGSFGFLMPFNPSRFQPALDRLLNNSLYYQDRNRIVFKISSKETRVQVPLDQRDPNCYHLLNEVVLKHSYGLNVSAGVSDIECRVNDHLLARYQGDGLILASPTGSTAYSLAVGGSIIHPSMKCLLISPIAPMTLSSRPLILPPDSIVTLSPVNNPVLLEGKFGRVVRPGEVIHITESIFPIPVFCRKDATSDFIHDLGTRLNYSRMVRFKRDDDDIEDSPSGPSGSFVAKRDQM